MGGTSRALAIAPGVRPVGPATTSARNTRKRTSWAKAANDPAAALRSWLTEGAPAGLVLDFDQLDGLYPRVKAEDIDESIDSLYTDHETFIDYNGVDEDDDAAEALDKYLNKGYLKEFHALADVTEHLGISPVMSKLGLVVKTKSALPVTRSRN